MMEKDALNQHAKTEKHKKAIRAYKTSRTIGKFFAPKGSSLEDRVAAVEVTKTFHAIKHHHSYNASDCGSKLDSLVHADSSVAVKIQLGRTKMEAIARNVFGALAVKTVANKLAADPPCPFSISIDASNKGNKIFPFGCQVF